MDIPAYHSDVSSLRRRLGDDPFNIESSEQSTGYSESLDQSILSDESDLADSDDDSFDGESIRADGRIQIQSSDHHLPNWRSTSDGHADVYGQRAPAGLSELALGDADDPYFLSPIDEAETRRNIASVKRVLALTSPRGSHRTHVISPSSVPANSSPSIEPLTHAERKAIRKARRKSAHAGGKALTEAVAKLRDSQSGKDKEREKDREKEKHKEKMKETGRREHLSSPSFEKPKLKRGRSRSLNRPNEPNGVPTVSISTATNVRQYEPSVISTPPNRGGDQLHAPILRDSGRLKESSLSILPPTTIASKSKSIPISSPPKQVVFSPVEERFSPSRRISTSDTAPRDAPLPRLSTEPVWTLTSPPLLHQDQFPKSASTSQFLSILQSINDGKREVRSPTSSTDTFLSSMSSISPPGVSASSVSISSTAEDDDLMLYVTTEKVAIDPDRQPLSLGLSSCAQPPLDITPAMLLHPKLDTIDPKYREVLDLLNAPQLEAVLRLMDELTQPPQPIFRPLKPPPPPEVDFYVGEELIPKAENNINPLLADRGATEEHIHPTPQPYPLPRSEPSLNMAAYSEWRGAIETEIKVRKELVSVKNWNEEFQRILKMPQDDIRTFSLLRSLGQDFVFTAETYGRIIISEMHLSPAEKTIKPVKIGGVAGGYKYICQGILFKFAVDTLLNGPNGPFWMYGDTTPRSEYAMKAAKHDLRGVISLYNCQIPNLRVALVALIDFRGFRLIAQALLPINKKTLQYGSDDGGKTFHSHSALSEMMFSAGKKLNLKPHTFVPYKQPDQTFSIVGPADVEGHVGEDGQFYMVDVARLMPAEAPHLALHRVPRSEFFHVLRPELVKKFRVPLSSDAWTPFGHTTKSSDDSEVAEATLFLQRQVIPEFAEKINNRVIKLHSGNQLVEEAHRAGINLRYLGAVRSLVFDERNRAIILLEMVLRVLKNRLRHKLRRQMERTRISTEAPYATVVLTMLNLVLYGRHKKRLKAKMFWTTKIKTLLKEKFVVGLNATELSDSVDLKESLDMQKFLDRFQVLTGVDLIPSAAIYRSGKSELIYTDIAELAAVTHHMNIVNYAEGSLLLLLSRKKQDKLEKLRLLNLAEHKLRLAKSSSAGLATLFQLGNVYYENSKEKPILQYADVINATKCFGQVIEQSVSDEEVHISLLKTMKLFYKHVRQAIWLQKKLFRKKATSTGTPSSSFTLEERHDDDEPFKIPIFGKLGLSRSPDSSFNQSFSFLPSLVSPVYPANTVIPADEYFIRLCAKYLDRLSTINLKEASKFVRRACKDQADALKWILLVAEHSTFVSNEVIRRLSRCDSLDFKDQPQLFVHDQSHSGMSSSSESASGSDGGPQPLQTPPIFKVFRVLQDEKKIKDLSRSSDVVSKSPPGDSAMKIWADANKSPLAIQSQSQKKNSVKSISPSSVSPIPPRAGSSTSFLASSSASSVLSIQEYLLPATQTLNLKGCVSLSLSTLSVLLRHTPNLTGLCLDHCAQIGDDLFQLLKKQRTRASLRLKKLSLMYCVCITDGFFSNMAASDLLRELRTLSASHCRLLTNSSLVSLSQSCSKLEEVTLGHCPQISELWLLRSSSALRKIEVPATNFADVDLIQFSALPFFSESIQELDVSDCRLTDEGFSHLAMTAKPLALRRLKLSNTRISDRTIDLLNRWAPNLCDLDLGFQESISRDAIVRLGTIQTHLQRLKLVNMKQGVNGAMLTFEHQPRPPPMEQLELPWCAIRDLMILGLAKTFKTLRSVDLTGCHEVSNHTLMSLKALSTLTYLNLSWCSQLVDTALNEILKSNRLISNLAVAHCAQLSCASLNEITREVIQLDISHCQMFSTLGKVPSRCLSLRQLNMAGTTVTPREMRTLFSFGISLSWLSLKGCKQVDNKVILRTAKYCPSLVYIDLDACIEITDDSLIELFAGCKFLQTLLLPGVWRVSDAAFVAGADNDGLQFLKEVNLSGCRKLTDTTVFVLTSRCPAHLQSLNLSGLNQVTTNSIASLVQKCHNLNSLNLFGVSVNDDIVSSLLATGKPRFETSRPGADDFKRYEEGVPHR